MLIYFSDEYQSVYLSHNSPSTPYQSNRERNLSFSGYFYNRLANTLGIPRSNFETFYNNLRAGTLEVPFTTSDGKSHVWKPKNPNDGFKYEFYTVGWDQADPQKHPEFREMHDRHDVDPKSIGYRFAIMVDEDGALIGIGALKNPTPEQLIRLSLAPLAEVATLKQIPDQTKSQSDFYFSDDVEGIFESALGRLVDPPYFTVVTK